MNKNLRKVVIAGNWKMNKTATETKALLAEMKEKLPQTDATILLCVPAINIGTAMESVKGTAINIGAQNCHWAKNGAFTAEISADMLNDFGVKYAIIGHSERRQYFGETDETVNKRAKACLESGISPIICVGENLDEREKDITKDVIRVQIEKGLADFTAEDMKNSIIAYEPVWAIGTGKTATAQQAEEVCAYIRELLAGLFGNETAQAVTIQYGGSMNAKNAAELLAMENIDGGLIGGASLKAEDFATIVSCAN
ncbi:MAG: triose-phosphate isomerase [Oscillospiraceae bacterium]|nr:triose-phosphate isomerase [Oscillospiraceae bacterium]